MPSGHVLHAGTRCLSLGYNKRAEACIVSATPLPYDLNPLHRCCHCGCHIGSLILTTHASQQTDASRARQGGQGRTLTENGETYKLIHVPWRGRKIQIAYTRSGYMKHAHRRYIRQMWS